MASLDRLALTRRVREIGTEGGGGEGAGTEGAGAGGGAPAR